jgi:hypothetical protein
MNFNRLLLKTVGLTLVVFLLDGCGAQIQPTATTPLPTATSVPPTTTSSTAPAVTVLPISSPQPVGDGVVDGWAVLAEKDDYDDVAMVNLPIDYIDITRISQLLLDSGWQKSRIRELREFDLEDMRQALAWLTENADADDIVLFYVSAHESYLHRVWWVGFFADNWAAVPSHQRVLLVEASAKFTSAVDGDERPYLSIATVDENASSQPSLIWKPTSIRMGRSPFKKQRSMPKANSVPTCTRLSSPCRSSWLCFTATPRTMQSIPMLSWMTQWVSQSTLSWPYLDLCKR